MNFGRKSKHLAVHTLLEEAGRLFVISHHSLPSSVNCGGLASQPQNTEAMSQLSQGIWKVIYILFSGQA